MTFGNILTFIVICYIIYYVGMIIYDTYFKKNDIVQEAKAEEEEVDISDEVQQFQPVRVSKEKIQKTEISSRKPSCSPSEAAWLLLPCQRHYLCFSSNKQKEGSIFHKGVWRLPFQ
jgi:hypothetical protein